MLSRRLMIAAGFCGLWAVSGCSGTPAKETPTGVKGIVTLAGKPLPEGTVSFSNSATGNAAVAQLGAEGKFTVTGGVVPGEYKVTITPPTPTPDNPAPKASAIPEKYRNEATSDLKAKISSGANDLKFELN